MGEWFLYAAPWSIIMSVVLYFVMITIIKPEEKEIEGGTELVKKQLKELGPISARE